ncbi:hypothetical protein IAU59_004374 [Kwoniella sp. CBS 9459]
MSSPPQRPPPPNPGDDNDYNNNIDGQPSQQNALTLEESVQAPTDAQTEGQGSPPSITFEFTLPGLLDGNPSNRGLSDLIAGLRPGAESRDTTAQGGQTAENGSNQSTRTGPQTGSAAPPIPAPEARAGAGAGAGAGSTAAAADGNAEAGHSPLEILWSFTIRPNADGGIPSIGLHPPPTGQNIPEQHPTNITGTGENNAQPQAGRQGLPPPWLFPPFFNFFMPMRTEPQPNPEKAAELLRSLPTVTRVSLARVDRIVAAQEKDSPPDEKGWKCGICLEGVNAEDVKGKGKAKEGGNEGASGDAEKIEVDEKQADQQSGTGVKALPCNHLFHADCLEPWFLTKHTCPSCRLDLDPLQTLNDPPPRQNPLRPSATGAGSSRSQNAHPYARNNGNTSSGSTTNVASSTAPEPAHNSQPDAGTLPTPSHGLPSANGGQGDNNQDHGPTITFFWSAPPGSASLPGFNPFRTFPFQNSLPRQESVSPMTVPSGQQPQASAPAPAPISGSSDTQAGSTTSLAGQGENMAGNAGLTAPSTPGPIFDAPTFTSPLQMASRSSPAPVRSEGNRSLESLDASAAVPSLAETSTPRATSPIPIPTGPFGIAGASAPSSASSDNRPQPQRRPHITIIRTSSPGPAGGAGPPPFGLPFLPLPPHLPLGMGQNQPSPSHLSSGTNTESASASGQAADTSLSAASAGTAAPASGSRPTEESDPSAAAAPGGAAKPFVPESLEKWILDREKSLGWRCDSPDCSYYSPPPSEIEIENEDGDVQMAETDRPAEGDEDDAGKQLMSVYSVRQPIQSSPYEPFTGSTCEQPTMSIPEIRVGGVASDHEGESSTSAATGAAGADAATPSPTGTSEKDPWAVLACPHRYHRKCVSRLEKLASAPMGSAPTSTPKENDEDERLWVRCAKCQKEGWAGDICSNSSKSSKGNENGAGETKMAHRAREGEDDAEAEAEDDDYAPSEKEVESLIAL